MSACIDVDIDNAARLRSSFLLFVMYFYPLVFGRQFKLSSPPGRQSHMRVIAQEFEECFYLRNNRLIINVPPRHGKTTFASFFIPWALASYPDSNFIYVSYSIERASAATELARRVVQLKEYGELFGVYVHPLAKGKERWQTTKLGTICAFGSAGSITGADAGLPAPTDRFTGCLMIDDLQKPDEAHSTTVMEKVITNYNETLSQRPSSYVVPIICIGQRLHEADCIAHLIGGGDGYKWKTVILPGRDVNRNPLYPEAFPLEWLDNKEKVDPYTFSSQIQQNPIPDGGGLFKREWFSLLDKTPDNIVCTFITGDTAETDKTYNCATVFSFWGLYKIEETGVWAIHCINSIEVWITPEKLHGEFMSFWHACQLFVVPPKIAAIEKKSTGVTLLAILKDLRGIDLRPIERTQKSAADRYISMQPFCSQGLISFTRGDKHTDRCVEHMTKITPNMTHRLDDFCDTADDAITIGLRDTTLQEQYSAQGSTDFAKSFAQSLNLQDNSRSTLWHRG